MCIRDSRLERATRYPMTDGQGPPGYKKNDLRGAELIAQDGTLPCRVVLRCLARRRGLLWKKEDKSNRQYLHMPDALFTTHCFFVACPPEH
eukprot:13211130-Alexandrium_andersonii.AAC.1